MEEGKGEKPVAAAAVEKKGVFAGVWEAVQRAPAADAGKREEESGRMITLQSSDGKLAKVTEASARLSKIIEEMIDSGSAYSAIPLQEVASKTLEKVIEYCDEHGNSKSNAVEEKERLKKWDETFIGELEKDKGALFDVIMAANFLNIEGLLNLTIQSVADTIKGKTPEEIRTAFNIENDLTDQDKEEILQENARAFEVYKPVP